MAKAIVIPIDGEKPAHGTLKVSRVARIKAKPIRPLWPGYLYRGKVTVLAGVPGDGKSLSTIDTVARISAGRSWPVGNGQFDVAPVLLLTAEDDVADTIKPRLDMAGADCEKVELIEGVHCVDAATGERTLELVSLTQNLPAIERKITELGAHLLVIDPLTSFADSDTNKTSPMRRLLDGIAQMAARTGVSVLVITHMNKRSDARKSAQMIAGSHVIVAAVRVVLVTARDPNDKGRRLILPIKLNIGPDDAGFAFRIAAKPHSTCGEVPVVEWESNSVVDLSADDVLIDSTPRAQAAVEKSNEVQLWLRAMLKEKPIEARLLWAAAKENNFSQRRVKAALKAIQAQADLLGYQGKWHYRLPDSDVCV
jgi:KaiC/GvpD/RAD55 family RecA-like ATPase